MSKRLSLPVILLLAMLALAACSKKATTTAASPTQAPPSASTTGTPFLAPTPTGGVTETVTVSMSDATFTPSTSKFVHGVPYQFNVTNNGKKAHDFEIMPPNEEDETKALLAIEDIDPGKSDSGSLTFAVPGAYEFASHKTGDYEGGMKVSFTVT